MPPKKKPKPNKVSPPANGKSPQKRSSRKAIFSRALDQESPTTSPEVATTIQQRPLFIPQSPPHALIRSLRRTLKKPTCSLFGPYQETIYSDFFFVLIVKATMTMYLLDTVVELIAILAVSSALPTIRIFSFQRIG
jgi:hypothetical protein